MRRDARRPTSARTPLAVREILRPAATLCVVALATVGLGACSGSDPASVVARIGSVQITTARLHARMAAMAHEVSPRRAQHEGALSLLISSLWLIGEAANQGQAVSHDEVERRLAQTSSSFPNGAREFREYLAVTGQSLSDMTLGIEAELAARKVSTLLQQKAPPVTKQVIAKYYGQNKQHMVLEEKRSIEVVRSTNEAAIRTVKTRAERGIGFITVRTDPRLVHQADFEYLVYTAKGYPTQENLLETAIFAARRNQIVGPVRVGPNYFLFRVTRIEPPIQQTLAEVQGPIRTQLAAEAHSQAIATFLREMSEKWTPKTDCSPGYVVQKCRQYAGRKVAEENPLERPGAPRGVTD